MSAHTAGRSWRSVRPNGSAAVVAGSAKAFPASTAALAAAAIVVYLIPALQRWLVLDRDAVAAGQLWRIATGNLVHFSASHLVFDLLAVGGAGALLERDGHRLWRVLAASAFAIGVAVLAFAPEVMVYGGLSGIAYTLVVLAALHRLGAPGRERAVALTVLALTVIKAGWEAWSGAFLFVGDSGAAFVPVPITHLTGAIVGVAAFVAPRAMRSAVRRRHEQEVLEVEAEVGQW